MMQSLCLLPNPGMKKGAPIKGAPRGQGEEKTCVRNTT